jgi:hypothetical protein
MVKRKYKEFEEIGVFVEFILRNFLAQMSFDQSDPINKLLPRRKEIYLMVKDHPLCSFDFIKRRFMAVNPKTLHYDIKKLQDEGLIVKVGKTRGSLYKIA